MASATQGLAGARGEGFARRLVRYAWGAIVRPRSTFDAMARETSVRWAVVLASLGVLEVWGNMLFFSAFGYDWLGSKPLLSDPTYVGGFGYVSLSSSAWLPIFAALTPVIALYGIVVVGGAAHLLAKLWGGQASFEQMVNVVALANVPGLVVATLSEWLTGVPLNLLSGRAYFYGSAMGGEYGPTMAVAWTVYASAIYTVPWIWGIVLGTIGIARVQRIPWPGAAFCMLVGFALNMLISTTFVR
jgi:hypothetical protein